MAYTPIVDLLYTNHSQGQGWESNPCYKPESFPAEHLVHAVDSARAVRDRSNGDRRSRGGRAGSRIAQDLAVLIEAADQAVDALKRELASNLGIPLIGVREEVHVLNHPGQSPLAVAGEPLTQFKNRLHRWGGCLSAHV